jgi:hypothetical protein
MHTACTEKDVYVMHHGNQTRTDLFTRLGFGGGGGGCGCGGGSSNSCAQDFSIGGWACNGGIQATMQAGWGAVGAVVGGVSGGPIGVAFGGAVGSVYGHMSGQQVESMICDMPNPADMV